MKPKRLVYGVGINGADYVVQKYETIGYTGGKRKRRQVWTCPYYRVWTNMLKRCTEKFQERHPTYAGCTVSDEWLTFSRFKSWMEMQNFEGLQIDKDLLIVGNRIYSEDTCMFVTQMVNSFTIDCGAARGEWLIGACWDKKAEKFLAGCRNPFTQKRENLGYFSTEKEAHEAWRKRKNELAHELAEIQTDERVAKALISRYTRTS